MPDTMNAITKPNPSSRNVAEIPRSGTQRTDWVTVSPSITPGAWTSSQTNVASGATATSARLQRPSRRPETNEANPTTT